MAAGNEKLTYPLPEAGHSRCFAGPMALFTLLPPCLSLSILPFYFTSLSDSIKETGIQTPVRWFFGDPTLPSSCSSCFPNKVVLLASTPRLRFIGLSCGEQSGLGFGNSFELHFPDNLWYVNVDWKNTPKSWELCFIGQKFLGLQAWEAASQVTLRKLLRGSEERARLYRSFATKGRESESQKIIVN